MPSAIRRGARSLVVASLVAAPVLGALFGCGGASGEVTFPESEPVQVHASLIAEENALPGTTAWRITRAAGSRLEGYASETSVQHGGSVDVHVRSDGPRQVRWALYRLGWYGGAGGRLFAEGGPVSVGTQPTPAANTTTGLVECRWPVSFRLATSAAWPSGMYVVLLTRDDGLQSYVPLVIRADERKGVAVAQLSVTTWQAYNNWGGESLYEDSIGLAGGFAREVSFNRPYADGFGAGQLFQFEYPFIQWAESRGYELTYLTNVDVDRDPSLLTGQRLYLSLGHNEYWSRPQREGVEAALAQGTNLAFLSADSAFWQIRLEPSRATGQPRRTEVCYKDRAPLEDPLGTTPLATVTWRSPPVNQPENALLGVMSRLFQSVDQPWIVAGSSSWIYAGTGLANGDTIPLLVGYESDDIVNNGLSPAGLVALAQSPTVGTNGEPATHNATVYTAPSGAFVFAAGTVQWSWGLAKPGYADTRVQRMTDNLFARAGLAPATAGATFGATSPPTSLYAAALPTVSTLAGAAFQEGLVDGAATAARFRRPLGVAVDASGNLFVADTGNHAIRHIGTGSGRPVRTIAGNGTRGTAVGAGSQARFFLPNAIAVGADQNLYVADTANNRIVRIARDASWTTSVFAGAANGARGNADGLGTAARFFYPTSIVAVGSDLYVTDSRNARIRRITPDGRVTTVVGSVSGFADGAGSSARLDRPSGIGYGGGALWVLDTKNRLVRKVALDGAYTTTTVAGRLRDGGFLDGAAADARFMAQFGITERNGTVLLADTGNSRIRSLAAGQVRTLAGSGRAGAADGAGNVASFSLPGQLLALPDGGMLVADSGSSTVRLLSPATSPPPEPPPEPPPPPPPGPITATFSDDFNACTSTSDLGPSWTVSGRWYCIAGYARGESADTLAVPSFDPPADVAVRTRLQYSTTVGTGSGVVARRSASGYYAARLLQTGRVQLVRVNGSTLTVLAEVAAAIGPAPAWHVVQLEVSGSAVVQLTALLNGTPVASASDSSASRHLAGRAGLLSGAAARTQYDLFWFGAPSGTVPPAPPPPPPPPGPGPITATFSDTFDACTSSSDLGPNWTVAGRWYCVAGYARGESADTLAIASFDPPGDHAVSARVQYSSVATGSGVVARQSASGYYAARLLQTGRVQIVRVNGTTLTVLADVPAAVSPAPAWYLLRLSVSGSSTVQLSVSVDGTLLAAATDTSAARHLSGRTGLLSGAAARTQFDRFWFGAP